MVVGKTERYVMLVQADEDIVVVPTLVAKLEREAVAAREHFKE